jgi:hypothetical protein
MPHQSDRLIVARWNRGTACGLRRLTGWRRGAGSTGAAAACGRLNLTVVLHHHAVEKNGDERIA